MTGSVNNPNFNPQSFAEIQCFSDYRVNPSTFVIHNLQLLGKKSNDEHFTIIYASYKHSVAFFMLEYQSESLLSLSAPLIRV